MEIQALQHRKAFENIESVKNAEIEVLQPSPKLRGKEEQISPASESLPKQTTSIRSKKIKRPIQRAFRTTNPIEKSISITELKAEALSKKLGSALQHYPRVGISK